MIASNKKLTPKHEYIAELRRQNLRSVSKVYSINTVQFMQVEGGNNLLVSYIESCKLRKIPHMLSAELLL